MGRVFQALNRLLTGADIDAKALVSRRAVIPHTIGIVIGETAVVRSGAVLMPHVVLGAREAVTSGRRHPVVESGALIGAGAKILGPITVGRGAKVGANAVVTCDVPPGATIVGVPGRILPASLDGAE